jgi:hypothetical protein
MRADLRVHDKGDGNPRAHVTLTARHVDERGEWGAKSRKEYVLYGDGERIGPKSVAFKSREVSAVDWNESAKAEEWRSARANAANGKLERRNFEARIDHRSHERRGLERIPTIRWGVAATRTECEGTREGAREHQPRNGVRE